MKTSWPSTLTTQFALVGHWQRIRRYPHSSWRDQQPDRSLCYLPSWPLHRCPWTWWWPGLARKSETRRQIKMWKLANSVTLMQHMKLASSLTMLISGVTLVKRVFSMKYPLSPFLAPPQSSFAPWVLAFSIIPRIFLKCFSLIYATIIWIEYSSFAYHNVCCCSPEVLTVIEGQRGRRSSCCWLSPQPWPRICRRCPRGRRDGSRRSTLGPCSWRLLHEPSSMPPQL